jgi:hypothetical protein
MDHHLKSEFVLESSLAIVEFSGGIRIAGHIACRGRIVIKVEKDLAVLDDDSNPFVVTKKYSYNSFVAGHATFLRHDNAHVHAGHADEHHYHRCDWRTGTPIEPPVWCGEAGWPNLSEFIHKVEAWYWEHRDELPDPDGAVSDLDVYDARLITL